MYRREGGSSKDLSLKELPVLLVTHVSKATKESRCSGMSLKYTLVACDKDDNFISLKVDTSVNDQIGLVKRGTVLRLVQFEPLYYGYEASRANGALLLLSNFSVLGRKVI